MSNKKEYVVTGSTDSKGRKIYKAHDGSLFVREKNKSTGKFDMKLMGNKAKVGGTQSRENNQCDVLKATINILFQYIDVYNGALYDLNRKISALNGTNENVSKHILMNFYNNYKNYITGKMDSSNFKQTLNEISQDLNDLYIKHDIESSIF